MHSAIMDNRLPSSASSPLSSGTLASELASRRAKPQSYFDRYPERKGQGPIVPSATLMLPQAKSSGGSSSRASSRSSSSTSRTSFDQQTNDSTKVGTVYSQETPRQRATGGSSVSSMWTEAREKQYDDRMARQWHTRKSCDEGRRVRGADAGQEGASNSAIFTQSPRTDTVGLPASSSLSSNIPPQPEKSQRHAADAALETYRARTVAASNARSSIAPGYPSPQASRNNPQVSPPTKASPSLAKETPFPLPRTQEASGAKETTSYYRPTPHPSKTQPVASINDIIRRHAPNALSTSPKDTPYEKRTLDSGMATSSTRLAPIESPVLHDSSGGSSIGSVEREIRRSSPILSVLPSRKVPSPLVSPALQAAFLRPTQARDTQRDGEFSAPSMPDAAKQQPSQYPSAQNLRPPIHTPSKWAQHITPSVSAPVLSQKKSMPKLFLTSRRRQSAQRSASGSAESAFGSGLDMARSSSASLAKSVTETSISSNLHASEHPSMLTRAKSTFDLRSPRKPTTPAKTSLQQRSVTKDTLPPLPLTPPYLRDTKSPSPISAASEYSIDEIGPDVRRYVRSAELTKLMTLTRAPYEGKTVSIADVGDPNGQAVVVFLGLGAVRYLIGLYTEMAVALNVRLICVDRWGMGRTDDMPSELRGVLEWSNVIAEVADRLGVARFSVMAHSAGAPYAMATALMHAERIVGPVHLLAPWVSPALESGYKWLRYVPDGVIRTAQAAEWRVQGWKLGASATPKSAIELSITSSAGDASNESEGRQRFSRQAASQRSASGVHIDLVGDDSFESDTSQRYSLRDDSPSPSPRSLSVVSKTRTTKDPVSALRKEHVRAPSADTLSGLAEHADMLYAWQRAESFQFTEVAEVPLYTPAKDDKVSPMQQRPGQQTLPNDSSMRAQSAWNTSALSSADLPTELLRASHAESGGSTNDLLVILGRASQKPWGFAYTDVRHAVRVWHGDKDERVGVASVLWMEREMYDCRLTLVKGANHGLMTNVGVVVEVLESIASFRSA